VTPCDPVAPCGPAGPCAAAGVGGTTTVVGLSQALKPNAIMTDANSMEYFMMFPLGYTTVKNDLLARLYGSGGQHKLLLSLPCGAQAKFCARRMKARHSTAAAGRIFQPLYVRRGEIPLRKLEVGLVLA
jgi:hypothetical protein